MNFEKTVEVDQGLRAYLTSIYNWMIIGLLVSAAAAFLSATSGLVTVLATGGILSWVVILLPFLLIFVMAGGASSVLPMSVLVGAFVVFTGLEGLSLSVVLAKYTAASVTSAFLATAAGFAGLSLWGYTTKVDLKGLGSFFLISLIGLIVASVIAAFTHSTVLNFLVSIVGVVIFAGLVAYDTQVMRADYRSGDPDHNARMAVWYALDLYLDFLNLFLFILRIVGVTSDND